MCIVELCGVKKCFILDMFYTSLEETVLSQCKVITTKYDISWMIGPNLVVSLISVIPCASFAVVSGTCRRCFTDDSIHAMLPSSHRIPLVLIKGGVVLLEKVRACVDVCRAYCVYHNTLAAAIDPFLADKFIIFAIVMYVHKVFL